MSEMLRRLTRRSFAGFTLIELLIVIIILGILMAIGIPAYLTYQSKAKDAAAKADLTTAFKALAATKTMNNGSFPTQSSMLAQARQDEPGMSYVSGIAVATSTPGKIYVSYNGANLKLTAMSKSGKLVTLTATSTDGFSQPAYVVSAPPVGYAAAIAADSPLAWWRLNDSSGNAVAAAGGVDGTPVSGGSITYAQAGATSDGNKAVSFSNAVNDHFDLGNNFNLSGATSYSLEAWVKVNGGSAFNQGIITKTDWSNGYNLDIDSGLHPRFFRCNGTSCQVGQLNGGGTITTGVWHHLVGVYDASVPSICLYLDGVKQTTGCETSPTGSLTTTPSALTIGLDASVSNAFNGVIDEPAVYASALSAAQVAAHYAAR